MYTAEVVDPQDFQSAVDEQQHEKESTSEGSSTTKTNTPTLLCLHGFATQPDAWLEDCANYPRNSKNETTVVIPILWAAADGLNPWQAYRADRTGAQVVGDALAPLLTCARALQNKSLMCHSMGNFVLQWAASPALELEYEDRFRDIFMVAPDTDQDMFRSSEGQNILKLVQNRVHVLHAKDDRALNFRQRFVIRRKALGLRGDPTNAALNFDCLSFSGKADPLVHHSYQFHPRAVQYYERWMRSPMSKKDAIASNF